jgi:hypothetical protein
VVVVVDVEPLSSKRGVMDVSTDRVNLPGC